MNWLYLDDQSVSKYREAQRRRHAHSAGRHPARNAALLAALASPAGLAAWIVEKFRDKDLFVPLCSKIDQALWLSASAKEI